MPTHFEEGLYRCRVTGQALVEGEQKGPNKQTSPSVQITQAPIGYYDSENEYHEHDFGYERTIYLYLTEDTIGTDPKKPGWVLDTLRYLGFVGTSFAQLDPSHPQACSFIDKEIDCLCRHEEYHGKKREKWSIFRPREKKEYAPPPASVVRTLDTKFGKLLKATQSPVPAVPAIPQVAPPATNGTPAPAASAKAKGKTKPTKDELNAAAQAQASAEAEQQHVHTGPVNAGPREEDIPF